MAREGGEDCEFFIYLLIYSNKLAYLQQVAVLVYASSSPKSHQQGYLNFYQKPWKIRVNEFIFRTCKFTKNKLFLLFSKDFVFKFCFIQCQGKNIRYSIHNANPFIKMFLHLKEE